LKGDSIHNKEVNFEYAKATGIQVNLNKEEK
jgi:hypothetical protein